MVELDALAPHYHWASNKGYGSAAHREALTVSGPHHQHRRSWRLTGSGDSAQPPGALHVPAGGAGALPDADIGPQRQAERAWAPRNARLTSPPSRSSCTGSTA